MTEEFKKFLNDCKKSILFYTISYFVIFMILKLIVNLLGYEFMQYVYGFSIITIIVGIIASIIQTFIRSKSKRTKICIIVCVLSAIIGCIVFGRLILLFIAFSFKPEHIVEKDNKKYVAYVYVWLDTRVEYYDYVNFLVRGKTKRIEDNYYNRGLDVLDEEHNGLYTPSCTYYYNDEGKIIDENRYVIQNNDYTNKTDEERYNEYQEQQNKQFEASKTIIPRSSDDVLYKKEIGENIVIRVVNLGAILAQRSVVQVQKSTNAGKTFEKMSEEGITIHNGAEFIFIDENIGFINDFGLAGTGGDNKFFYVTTDGGKTFVDSNIVHPDSIEEKNLLVKGMPYIEDGKLKLEVYTLNHFKTPERTYYIFSSNDNGLNWNLDTTEIKEYENQIKEIENKINEKLKN